MLSAIIVAGGSSQRMGSDKLFASVAGELVIVHAIRAFDRAPSVSEIIVVAREERHDEIQKISRAAGSKNFTRLSPAGNAGRIP